MSKSLTKLLLHESVPETTQAIPNLHSRLGLVLQQLAAHGRTGVVKGCSGENRGWRRSPLGGNGGMQYYLWWIPQGNNILARAVRHHDDHTPLAAGDLNSDYYQLNQSNFNGSDENFVSAPWTEGQLRFINDGNPIRVIYGHPGSGKTTALWRAVEAGARQQVLYVSWSRDLTSRAKERFAAFAPDNVSINEYDFVTLLSRLCGYDVQHLTYAQSRAAFAEAMAQTRLGRTDLGPWAEREDGLYAELRAVLLGRAIPGERGCIPYSERFWRLNDAAYLKLRYDNDAIGKPAADACLRVADSLERRATTELAGAFPELAAASTAIHQLRSRRISEQWSNFDCIAVDEIQDLTLTEIAVIAELCRALNKRREYEASLLVAGDEGQTVRPSGFEWARLNQLLSDWLSAPQEFSLDTTMRAPRQIASVIEQSEKLYVNLNRQLRPSNRQAQSWGGSNEARLFYVSVPDALEAISLLEQLNEMNDLDLEVVTPDNDVPEWVPEHLRNTILTPHIVKGLEYQATCVLNVGRQLQELSTEINEYARAQELEFHYRRTGIDRLRVALSRATEALIFVDVAADDTEREQSRSLLGDEADVCSPDYLVEHFTDADATTDERVLRRINQAKQLIDNAPERAWERSIQAMRLLGNDADLDNGIIDQTVRFEASTNLLTIAARLLVDDVWHGVSRGDVINWGDEVAATLEGGGDGNAFRELADWTGDLESPPFKLLEAGITLGYSDGWLRSALPSVSRTLLAGLRRYAADPVYAQSYDGDVEGWLQLVDDTDDVDNRARELRFVAAEMLIKSGKEREIENWLRRDGYTGEVDGQAKAVRYTAAEALMQAGKSESVERFLSRVSPPDWELTARLQESQRDWANAIVSYERACLKDEASRVRNILARTVHFKEGQINLAEEEWDKAIAAFERAIAVKPNDADFYNGRGLAYHGKREFDRAILDYSQAIALDPSNADFYGNRGLAYRWQINTTKAIADYNMAIALNPDISKFHAGRGNAYARRCEFDLAIQDYDQAISIDPGDSTLYASRGRIYFWKGDRERAEQDLMLG